MKDEELIDKEFEFFKYKTVNHLTWEDNLEKYIGLRCKVLNVNTAFSQFARCKVYPSIGKTFIKHFPKELVIEQIEKKERENMSIDDILSEMKQLTSKI
jgi:hypothetical protein